MSPRSRSLYQDTPKGVEGRFGSSGGGFQVWEEKGSVSDQTGPGDCAPFAVSHQRIDGGRINQPYTGFFASYFDNYRADLFDNPNTFAGHIGLPDSPSDVTVATELAARTNPSRPYVDVAANVLELGDLTGMIREKGLHFIKKFAQSAAYRNRHGLKKLAKIAGDVNLEYNFGIAPLVGDLVKLCNFQDAFTKRCREVAKLRSSRGYRRTINVGRYSAVSTSTEVLQSLDKYITTNMVTTTTQEVRGHIRWITDEDPSHLLPDAELADLVRKAVVNIDPTNAGSIWEGIPWSWLIDWGYNVGTYFKATRNVIPARLDGVHVMRHTKTTYRTDAIAFDNVTVSPAVVTYETKTRNPSFVFPTAQFPFLNGYQMGILASLAITRS